MEPRNSAALLEHGDNDGRRSGTGSDAQGRPQRRLHHRLGAAVAGHGPAGASERGHGECSRFLQFVFVR